MHHPVLDRIEAGIRAVGRMERTLIALPHFEVFLSPARDEHLSYATPLPPDPADWSDAIEGMRGAFDLHGRRPRLEYIAELHPELAGALERAGMVCRSRDPVMILDLSELPPPPPSPQPPPTGYVPLTAPDERLLRAWLEGQSIAFGGPGGPGATDWLPMLQSGLASGRIIGAALLRGDRPLSGAVIQTGAGIGELAGVWTAQEERGRGLAFALCRRLLAEFAATGCDLCWLSAAEDARRLYGKLGFIPAGTQLNY